MQKQLTLKAKRTQFTEKVYNGVAWVIKNAELLQGEPDRLWSSNTITDYREDINIGIDKHLY